uniref:Uncharacterized protein n=1 Tax=Zea mays TaxID=4577 RepID=C4J6T6_MAIZE|nr:unknown [Zea mays]
MLLTCTEDDDLRVAAERGDGGLDAGVEPERPDGDHDPVHLARAGLLVAPHLVAKPPEVALPGQQPGSRVAHRAAPERPRRRRLARALQHGAPLGLHPRVQRPHALRRQLRHRRRELAFSFFFFFFASSSAVVVVVPPHVAIHARRHITLLLFFLFLLLRVRRRRHGHS